MGNDDILSNNSDLEILRMDGDDAESTGSDETSNEAGNGNDEITFSDDEASDSDETGDESDETLDKSKKTDGDDEPDLDEEFTGDPDAVGDYSPVSKTELLKAYPDIFKKFPQIQNTFAREQAYTELFPTVEDAESAAQYQEAFHTFEQNIASGDPSHLLDSIKKMDPNVFGKFTGNFMDTLYKADRDQFNKVLQPITKKLVRHIFADAVRSKNENLQNAAQWFSDYLFGVEVERIPEDRKTTNEVDPERDKFEKEREAHAEREYTASLTEVSSAVDKKLDSFLSGIDPNNKLSSWAKKKLIGDIKEEVAVALRKETPLQRTLGNLWARGKKFGYSSELRQRISNLYLARAKQVAPDIAKRLVREAIGSTGSKPTIKKNTITPGGGRPAANGNKATKVSSNKAPEPKLIDWSKTSDRDILGGKATLRKQN